jgi:hypothetical protein
MLDPDDPDFSYITAVDQATPETAVEVADILVELLSDEETHEQIRRDMRSRLASLYHRFPEAFDDIVEA